MKKAIIFLILLLIPLYVNAATGSIKNAYIAGVDTANVGSEFTQSFMISFSNINKGTDDTYGIWLVGFEIVYDDSAFVIESISSDGGVWASTVYKENGKTYVLSQFSKDTYHNACVDGVLYCADYGVTIKFYVKDTTKTSSTIKMRDVEAGVFKVSGNLNPEYNVSDMIELNYSSEASSTIKINRPANVTVKEPKSIISSKPKTKTPATTAKKTTTTKPVKKSTNNYLKSLEINGYSINFSKDQNTYNINVKSDVNTLEVKALSEDTKATVEIIGADDLELNDDRVKINVKAENGKINTYTVFVKKEIIEEDYEEDTLKNGIQFIKQHKKYVMIGGLVIFALILIMILKRIITSFSDKKIDKSFDSF